VTTLGARLLAYYARLQADERLDLDTSIDQGTPWEEMHMATITQLRASVNAASAARRSPGPSELWETTVRDLVRPPRRSQSLRSRAAVDEDQALLATVAAGDDECCIRQAGDPADARSW
jgi:hypothetical protein